jgi:DNA-binding NtrC family response regulator
MRLPTRQRELPLNTLSTFILCVDDKELPLALRKLVLEMQGYQVIAANSASDAMRALSDHIVDLVLTDQVMPGGTGTELAQSIKRRWPGLPIILISGINEIPPDAVHADLFISKVEGPAALCAKISAILSARPCSLG